MNLPFTTKLALNGVTWDYFFENVDGRSSRSVVLDYCQERPRDVLTYCSFAIESAQSQKHTKIQIEDLQAARRRFSDSRLKDLGDEYQENYPQIQLILTRFYGLGKEFTVNGVDIFIQKLLADQEVEKYCGSWLHAYTSPELFIHLLYNIGFAGLRNAKGTQFRSLGPRSSTPPPIGADTQIVIHPSYAESLNLQNKVIGVGDIGPLQTSGLLADLPGSIDLNGYQDRLRQLQIDLKTLPLGREKASIFEDIVGEILHLCFFRALTNVEAKSRVVSGCVIRDWIAANTAPHGFWELIRQRYQAMQVTWECKNYEELAADDFQQAAYYMTKEAGYFVVLCFRGEMKKHYYDHVKRISSERNGIVLILSDRDLQVFMRQAMNGKPKEDHIQGIYDTTLRSIA